MNKIIKNALQNLYGTELFDKATELVYDKLKPQYCYIGYFDEHKKQVYTLSYRANGEVAKNFSYSLVDTPCKNVQSDRCTCHYPSSVQALFPHDKPLQDLNAEGYLGVPIFAHTNEPVGIVVCLFDEAYEHSQEIEEWSCNLSYFLGVELKYSALLSKQEKLMWELEEGQRVAKIGSWHWDLTTNAIAWSKELYRIYGIDDLTLTPSLDLITQFIHPDDKERVVKALNDSLESDKTPYNLDHRVLLADGTVKHLRKRSSVTWDPNGNPLIMKGTVQDVTDFYHVSAKLTQTSNKLHTTYDSAEEGIWEYDLSTGKFLTSLKFWSILGKDKPDNGKDFTEWVACLHPENRKEGLNFFNRFREDHYTVFNFAFRLAQDANNPYDVGQERWLKLKGRVVEKDGDGNPTRIAGIQRDATTSVETERQLSRAKVVFDNTSECILITDNNNRIISVNHAFERTTGYKQHELLGLSPSVLSSGLHDKEYYQSLWLSLQTKGCWKGEVWNRRKSGEIYPEETSINVIKDSDGSVVNYVAVFRDISHWKKAEEQLTFFAYYDALTGLVNRRSFTERVEKQSKQVKMNNQVFAILFIDMDDFKSINDLYGHDFGDRVLAQIADRLKLIFPEHDNICRYGGDEFSVLLPNVNAEQASELAQEVNRAIAEPINIDDIEVNTTVSIGISAYPDSGLTHHALLKNADYAMYNMKGQGRNGVCLYDHQLQTQDILKLQLRDRLKKAIAEQTLSVCYQPIIHTQTGRIVKFEALARWHDDIQGDISPAVFIPIAEKYGLINQLGMLVLHQACQDLKKIHTLGYDSICCSINRSVKEFINRGQDECICDVIQQYELPNSSIVIEITETTASKESRYIHDVLARFKDRGIKVALDDFGTGYSSLGAIVDLRPDIIKIDRSFITEIESNSGSQTLVSLVLELSHKLGIKVVAEGVETKAQLDLLMGMNCHYIQGFYVSRAKPIDACINMLMNESTLMTSDG
ncbi:EAL domain-containing protein [Photobacterium sagamiensis]|uniref:sensor domain-containing protein n=1 Tax=Photobacterium sagamiensis TaxID=2910241 RepID=UPI003D0D1B5C